MLRLPAFIAAAIVALTVPSAPAAAERLIASLSHHRVEVTSNFSGEELVLFGGIERDASTPQRRGGYDIVATIAGPRQNLVTYRKNRVLGIWVNADSRVFERAPAYLAVISNRPLDEIASPETLRRLQLGLDNVVLLQRAAVTIADSAADDPYRLAFLDLMQKRKLYQQVKNGVTFLAALVYRAAIPLPAEAPIGSYDVDVRLFVDGAMIDRTNSALEIYKSGFEQTVSRAARDHGLLYGIGTAMMALVTGWFASVVFRRD